MSFKLKKEGRFPSGVSSDSEKDDMRLVPTLSLVVLKLSRTSFGWPFDPLFRFPTATVCDREWFWKRVPISRYEVKNMHLMALLNLSTSAHQGTKAHVKVGTSGCVSQPDWPAVDLTKEFLPSRFSIKDIGEADVILVSILMDISEKLIPNNGQVVSQLEYSMDTLMRAGSAILKTIRLPVAGYLSHPQTRPGQKHVSEA
nr:hypothetical protein [Tanacetum cinerariifolium]